MTLGELHAVSASVRTVYVIFTDEGEFIEDFTIDYTEKGEDFSKNIVKRDSLIQKVVYAEMVKVKTFFSGWKEISKEQALRWAQHIYNGMLTRTGTDKVDYINARLDGIQFIEQELRR